MTDDLRQKFPARTVFATPANFLTCEGLPRLAKKHARLIDSQAVSVLLLPSQDSLNSVDLVVGRQLNRWPETKPVVERRRYIDRHSQYKRYGTIKIYGQPHPDKLVNFIIKKLKQLGCLRYTHLDNEE